MGSAVYNDAYTALCGYRYTNKTYDEVVKYSPIYVTCQARRTWPVACGYVRRAVLARYKTGTDVPTVRGRRLPRRDTWRAKRRNRRRRS